MFCGNCGFECQEGARFCGKCGAPVGKFTQTDGAMPEIPKPLVDPADIAPSVEPKPFYEEPVTAKKKKKGLGNLILKMYATVERFVMRHADAVIGTGPGLVEDAMRRGREKGYITASEEEALREEMGW